LGEEVRSSTIVSEIASGLAGVGAGALPSGAAAAGYCERQSQGEIIRQRQRELTDAQTQLAVAQMNLQANDKDVVAIDAQIREVQGY